MSNTVPTSISEHADVPAVLTADDVEISWGVSRVVDTDQVSQWAGTIHLVTDDDDPSAYPQVGLVIAYNVPDTYNGNALSDLDCISEDLLTVGSTVLDVTGGGLRHELVETYGDENYFDSGLLIVDHIKFDPAVRGRGLLKLVLRDLVFNCRGVGLVALIAFAHDEDGQVGAPAAQKRLAAHYAEHGFHRVTGSEPVMVSNPGVLLGEVS